MKKLFILFPLLFLAVFTLFAQQQITRFAVVDTSRVYQAYFRDSQAVRNYEAKKAEFQSEMDRLTNDLKNMQVRKTDMQKNGDETGALRLETDMTSRAAYLTEYTRAKNIELENLRKRLENSDDFYGRLYGIIGKLAELEGISMVMSLQQSNAILWYSPTVDITDKVITALAASSR